MKKQLKLRNKSNQKFDRVWAVFDRDSFKSTSFNSAILKAKANGIDCAWSNEAFELWYLLHFHNRVTAMDRKEYEEAIEEAVNDKLGNSQKKFVYKKNEPNMYLLINKLGNQELAIKWAKGLNDKVLEEKFADYNPATQVFQIGRRVNWTIRTFK